MNLCKIKHYIKENFIMYKICKIKINKNDNEYNNIVYE